MDEKSGLNVVDWIFENESDPAELRFMALFLACGELDIDALENLDVEAVNPRTVRFMSTDSEKLLRLTKCFQERRWHTWNLDRMKRARDLAAVKLQQ